MNLPASVDHPAGAHIREIFAEICEIRAPKPANSPESLVTPTGETQANGYNLLRWLTVRNRPTFASRATAGLANQLGALSNAGPIREARSHGGLRRVAAGSRYYWRHGRRCASLPGVRFAAATLVLRLKPAGFRGRDGGLGGKPAVAQVSDFVGRTAGYGGFGGFPGSSPPHVCAPLGAEAQACDGDLQTRRTAVLAVSIFQSLDLGGWGEILALEYGQDR